MRSSTRLFMPLALLCLALAPALLQAQPLPCINEGRQALLSPAARRAFPHLGNRFVVIGCATPRYNCIAHSMGYTSEWVWPGNTVAAFNDLYRPLGFRRITEKPGTIPPGQLRREVGVERLVLFATESDGRFSATHAARQSGHPGHRGWTSKLGQWPLIWHPSLRSVTGPSYGRPIAVYVRPIP
jgi:type VI secretion system secreted protein VgrG